MRCFPCLKIVALEVCRAMNKSVKFLAGLMSLIFVFALFPMTKTRVNAYTDTHGYCGKGDRDVNWTFLPGIGMLLISGRGEMKDFYEGTAPWYTWKDEIKEVRIYNGVKSIGRYSFANCEKMENVSISSSVESIGEGAFRCCRRLSTVEIPDSVTSIEYGAFYSCGLTSVKLSKNISEIPGRAFFNSIYLTSIFIPEKVDRIGEDAFSWSPRLKTVEYEGYPSFVDASAFSNCDPEITITSPRMIFYTSNGHGTVSGKDHADIGECVELTVRADFGYEVDRVSIISGKYQISHIILPDLDGVYRLYMPRSETPVTVHVVFVSWEPEPEPDPTPTPTPFSSKKEPDSPKQGKESQDPAPTTAPSESSSSSGGWLSTLKAYARKILKLFR